MSNCCASDQDYGNTDDALLVMPEQFEELQGRGDEQDTDDDEEE